MSHEQENDLPHAPQPDQLASSVRTVCADVARNQSSSPSNNAATITSVVELPTHASPNATDNVGIAITNLIASEHENNNAVEEEAGEEPQITPDYIRSSRVFPGLLRSDEELVDVVIFTNDEQAATSSVLLIEDEHNVFDKSKAADSNAQKQQHQHLYQQRQHTSTDIGNSGSKSAAETSNIATLSAISGEHANEQENQQQVDNNVRKWWYALPAPLFFIFEIVYLAIRNEDDTFEVTMRKVVFSVTVVFSPGAIGFSSYWFYRAVQGDPAQLGLIVAGICLLLATIVVSGSVYLYVRFTKTAPTALTIVWLILVAGLFGCVSMGVPRFPVTPVAIILAHASVFILPNHFMWTMVAISALYFLAMFESNLVNANTWPLPIQTPYDGEKPEIIIFILSGIAVWSLMIIVILVHNADFEHLHKQSASFRGVGQFVAESVQNWTFKLAENTLTRFEKEAANLPDNKKFLVNLRAIVNSLQDLVRFVPKEIMEAIRAHGMERLPVSVTNCRLHHRITTVMRVEIKNFCALAEAFEEHKSTMNNVDIESDESSMLGRMLSDVFAKLTTIVTALSGTVLDCNGSGFTATWGVRKRTENMEMLACLAALQILRTVQKEIAPVFEKYFSGFSVRIGLMRHTSVFGHVGSDARCIFTAIGDAAAGAQVTCDLNKLTPRSCIIVPDETLHLAQFGLGAMSGGSTFATRNLGVVRPTHRVTSSIGRVHQLIGANEHSETVVDSLRSSQYNMLGGEFFGVSPAFSQDAEEEEGEAQASHQAPPCDNNDNDGEVEPMLTTPHATQFVEEDKQKPNQTRNQNNKKSKKRASGASSPSSASPASSELADPALQRVLDAIQSVRQAFLIDDSSSDTLRLINLARDRVERHMFLEAAQVYDHAAMALDPQWKPVLVNQGIDACAIKSLAEAVRGYAKITSSRGIDLTIDADQVSNEL